MRNLALTMLTCLALCSTPLAAAELVVIVNPHSGVESISRREAINIFMGRYQRLPSGIAAVPLDLDTHREDFYLRLTRRTLPEINSYWARLVFSGRGSPPRQFDSAEQVIEMVAGNRGGIGYIPRDKVDPRVSMVLELSE